MMRSLYSKALGLLLGGVLIASCSQKELVTADYQIVPLPLQISDVSASSSFLLKDGVKVIYPEGNDMMRRNAEFLADYVKQQTGISLNLQAGAAEEGAICLALGLENQNAEAYQMKVDDKGVQITGASEAGVFYGIQTFRKSLSAFENVNVQLPAVEINDAPRFAYRGMHLDVARHFYSLDEVKEYIDMMALHNMNRFHWHLTDDQGWRIEIKKYPKLMSVASQRSETLVGRYGSGKYDGTPYGGYYTQEQIKEVIAYAADRHIVVIPEIDLPGHMQAAITAYPELGCTGGPYEVRTTWGISDDVLCIGNEKSMEFVKDVLAEVAELFPSEYIHVGGDECPKVRWAKCPKCQALIKKLGLKSDASHTKEERLQSYVITEAEKFLNSKGKQIIGWTEILEGGLSPNATLMSWIGEAGGIEAARQHHDVIMTPNTYLYFDYYQASDVDKEPLAIGGYLPMEKVYSYEPMPSSLTAEEQQYIKGVQANLWTEYIPTFSQAQYMVLPRMAALAETQWSDGSKKDYQNFLKRMPRLTMIYDCYKWNYAKHIFNVNVSMKPAPEAKALEVTLVTIPGSDIYYTLDGSEPGEKSQKYTEPFFLNKSAVLKAVAIQNSSSRKVSDVVTETVETHKAFMKPFTLLQENQKKFTPNGPNVLVDGRKGGQTFSSGGWVAVQGNDIEAAIDLEEMTEISSVSVDAFVNRNDWIFDARAYSVAVSEDGKTYKKVASEIYPAMKETDTDGIKNHTLTFSPVKARFVKVKMDSEHAIPSWHGAKGKAGHLFVDEIIVK